MSSSSVMLPEVFDIELESVFKNIYFRIHIKCRDLGLKKNEWGVSILCFHHLYYF